MPYSQPPAATQRQSHQEITIMSDWSLVLFTAYEKVEDRSSACSTKLCPRRTGSSPRCRSSVKSFLSSVNQAVANAVVVSFFVVAVSLSSLTNS